jgi:hypothetical protein
MIAIGTLGTILILLAAGPADDGPKQSADVVEVKLQRGSLADGLETYFVSLKVAKGWQVYANPAGAKAVAGSATVIEFLIDGKRTAAIDIYYPKGVARKDAAGNEYRVYQGTVSFTGWLVYDDTKDACAVSVRVKVTATDGKKRLKESTVTAEAR